MRLIIKAKIVGESLCMGAAETSNLLLCLKQVIESSTCVELMEEIPLQKLPQSFKTKNLLI